MDRRSSGEFELIERLKRFQNLSRRVIKGIGDDAAVLELDAKRYQLFTTDMCVESVHFTRKMPARKIGWKAMAVNVSDIAAMGGEPTCAVVSIGFPGSTPERVLPPAAPFPPRGSLARSSERGPASGVTRSGLPVGYVEKLYQGLFDCAKAFGVSIVGGDTVRADRLVINVALLGEVWKKDLVLRSGAKVGEGIFVTGSLGGSFRSGRHLTFRPRLKEAQWLVKNARPSSMMDLSDGLAGDLGHILKASRVGALLEEQAIPLHRGVSLDRALSEGEDFELLFTAPLPRAERLKDRAIRIGTVTEQRGFWMRGADGKKRKITMKGFAHF
ncbi:MAG: thiamine-monophosphate kinase [Elusimicrobia bacterium]|nr:thiamine-monophosphate kinase [Elusimicrobiota bacterium]